MKKILCILFFVVCFTQNKAQVLNTTFCQTPGQVYAVAIDSVNNIVYVGGNFTQICGSPRQRIAAMNLSTGALLSWNPGSNNDVYSLYVHNGALYAGGFFTTIGGQAHNHIAKFKGPAGAISTWDPNITSGNYVNAIVGKGNKIFFGGDLLLTVGTGKNIAEVDTGTAAPTSWADYPNNFVSSIAIDGNSLYIGGTFTQLGATVQSYIAKYDLSGGAPTLTAWNPNLDNNVQSLCAKSGTLYAGGAFGFANTDNRDHIAELDTSSGTATGWNPGADNDIFDLEYRNGILYALGNASVFGGVTQNFIAALDVTSNNATSWNPMIGATVSDAAIAGNQIFLGGGFSSVLGQSRSGFAVVCINPIGELSGYADGPYTVCTGLSGVSYSVQPVNGATSYVWSYSGTGVTINGTSNAVTLDYANGATGGVLSVAATNGCQSSATQTVAISPYTFATTVAANSNLITCGDSVDISSSDNYQGGGTITYSWLPAAGLNASNVYKVTSGTHTTRTYTLTETSSEGCVAIDNTTISVAPIALSPASAYGTILCSTKDTLSVSTNYGGPGTLSYTWSPASSVSLPNAVKTAVNPITTTNYTVTALASDGCTSTPQTIGINVTDLTLSPSASISTITCGNTSTLSVTSDYPGTGAITYTWSPAADLSNANAASPVASPTAATTYTVDITTAEGCVSSDVVTVSVNALQVFTTGTITTTCSSPVTLNTSDNSGNVNLVYSWSPAGGLSSTSSSAPSANVGTTTIFTVTMSLPGTGCSDAVAVDTVKVLAPAAPNICEITSDSLSQYNVIYWDKTSYQVTDSFIVYRETITNVYTKIATIPYTALSQYTDTARSIGPSNGDPNVGTYRYKLAVKDSCGNISALSPYHNTVFFVDNHTGTFTWNLYAVENQATPVTQYDLLRDNANNGTWIVIGTVTGTQTTLNDPLYSTYSTIANWRVQSLGFNCTPTARYGNNSSQGAIVKSKSNITNNRQIGIKTNAETAVAIYPNPSNGNFVIDLGNAQGKATVKIISLLGQEVYSAVVNASEKLNIDLGDSQNGTYLVQITTNNVSIIKRIIKN